MAVHTPLPPPKKGKSKRNEKKQRKKLRKLSKMTIHSKKCQVNYAPTLKTGSKNNHEKGYFDCKRGYNFDHES